MTKKMKLTLAKSVFENAPVVSVAAKPGGADVSQNSSPEGKISFYFITCESFINK